MTDSSKTALLKQLATLLYICFGFLIVKDETFSVGKLVGGLVGFAGIALINSGSGSLQLGLGDWLIIAASVCAVISNLTIKQALKKSTPIMATGVSHFFGGVVMLVIGLAGGGTIAFTAQSIPIFAYICVASIVSYVLWNYALQLAELSKMFIIKFTEPLFACLFGWILLGEDIFKWEYLGAFVLICGGICLGNVSLKSKKETIK
jgi:drug/metabolite transporter (DMT)-like permease